jgi:hypothetical protein
MTLTEAEKILESGEYLSYDDVESIGERAWNDFRSTYPHPLTDDGCGICVVFPEMSDFDQESAWGIFHRDVGEIEYFGSEEEARWEIESRRGRMSGDFSAWNICPPGYKVVFDASSTSKTLQGGPNYIAVEADA